MKQEFSNKAYQIGQLSHIAYTFLKECGVTSFLNEMLSIKEQMINDAINFNEANNIIIIKEKIINNHNLTRNTFIEFFELYKKTLKNIKSLEIKGHIDNILQSIFESYKAFEKNHAKDFHKIKVSKTGNVMDGNFHKFEDKLDSTIKSTIIRLIKSVLDEPMGELSFDELLSINNDFYKAECAIITREVECLKPYYERLHSFIKQFDDSYLAELNTLSQKISKSNIKTEVIKVQSFIKAAKESYDRLLKEHEYLGDILKFEKATIPTVKSISIKDNIDSITFKQAVFTHISSIIKDFTSYKKCIYEYNKIATDVSLLMDSIIRHIEGIKALSSSKNPIVAGIKETLAIKLETLLEEQDSFKANISQIITKSDFSVILNNEELTLLGEDLLLFYINNDSLKAFTEKYDILTQGKYKDYHEKQKQLIQSKAVNFYKNVLLYELATMEEMFYYSLTRLRTDTTESSYTSAIMLLLNDIRLMLKKHDIHMITPKENEVFDGKLHNIILAEVKEGIKKGKIISVISPGYKYMDKPLIRANVIVTK